MIRLSSLLSRAVAVLIAKFNLSHKEHGVFMLPKRFTHPNSAITHFASKAEKFLKPLVLMNLFIVRHYDYLNPKTYS